MLRKSFILKEKKIFTVKSTKIRNFKQSRSRVKRLTGEAYVPRYNDILRESFVVCTKNHRFDSSNFVEKNEYS